MAENAAHISTLTQLKPTIFEVVAQDSLMANLKPSLKLLFGVLGGRHPERYQGFLKWFDEFYLFLDFFLQNYYLKTSQASFSEAFYGLRRISNRGIEVLSNRERYGSLLFLVGFPYLRYKLQMLANKCQAETYGNHSTKATKSMNFFVNSFKAINVTFECLKLFYYLKYLLGNSLNHSPLLTLAGVHLVYQKYDPSKITWRDLYKQVVGGSKNTTSTSFPIIVHLLTKTLEIIAFFVQFLKWWHGDELRIKLNAYPVPRPPNCSSNKTDTCPLCLKKRKVEVALKTSGYVFCYNCIQNWLVSNKRCPVTHIPSSISDLIRLYPTGKIQ